MYEVYFWDGHTCRFRVHASFTHYGAAQVVAGRLAAGTGNPHFVRFRAAA